MFSSYSIVTASSEDKIIGQYKVDYSRNAHSNNVAEYHIKACKTFDQDDTSQSQKKDSRAGQIVGQILLQEISEVSHCIQPVLPYIEIEYGEIDKDCTLE